MIFEIDVTPTWSEWGQIFARFVMTGETKAATSLLPDIAQALAAAQALQELCRSNSLTKEQRELIKTTMEAERAKAKGYLQVVPQYLNDEDSE